MGANKGRLVAEADRLVRIMLDKGTPRGLSNEESASLLYVLELLDLDKRDMLLKAQFPIGTTVYQASYGGQKKRPSPWTATSTPGTCPTGTPPITSIPGSTPCATPNGLNG